MKRRTYDTYLVYTSTGAVGCVLTTPSMLLRLVSELGLGFVKRAFDFVPYEIYKIMILLAISETSTFCQEKRRRNAELGQ
jgi:hypothetical protein